LANYFNDLWNLRVTPVDLNKAKGRAIEHWLRGLEAADNPVGPFIRDIRQVRRAGSTSARIREES
jgi:hypothetical protein